MKRYRLKIINKLTWKHSLGDWHSEGELHVLKDTKESNKKYMLMKCEIVDEDNNVLND